VKWRTVVIIQRKLGLPVTQSDSLRPWFVPSVRSCVAEQAVSLSLRFALLCERKGPRDGKRLTN
jgi:hypothetical protein